MTRFNACIDLHNGQVKQIVGGSLNEADPNILKTNFVSKETPKYYGELYKKHNITRAHVIKLGPNNDEAAKEALAAWPGGLQVGGGISVDNAQQWIDLGASKVIVTSYLFPNAKFSLERLQKLCEVVGKDKLVVDVRELGSAHKILQVWCALRKDNKFAQFSNNQGNSEFLVHAADVEGLCKGIDQDLVQKLGEWTTIPTTYAGGGNNISDLELVDRLSNGKVDLTFGSALDIFGGSTVKFEDCIEWNSKH
ncbi:hypothetical protein NQZ79_g1030 [Umbelopsis isabellina]|nr:hypothetical protein NQZ79_g1030 [Umbelopsis isabellina]